MIFYQYMHCGQWFTGSHRLYGAAGYLQMMSTKMVYIASNYDFVREIVQSAD